MGVCPGITLSARHNCFVWLLYISVPACGKVFLMFSECLVGLHLPIVETEPSFGTWKLRVLSPVIFCMNVFRMYSEKCVLKYLGCE